ncbi:glycosyltransferase [Geodermatophilus sp. SYSU D00758]
MSARPSLSVAVLVELVRTPASGGHVKCWERLAEAATGLPGLDLTVYVLGRPGREDLSPSVRFASLRPVLGTGAVHRLVGGVDGADLAPFHPALARRLPQHDVWHLTHTLAFGATAVRLAPGCGRRLVTSIHTDVPSLVGAYTTQVAGRLPPPLRGAAARPAVAERAAALARRRRDRLLRASAHLLASSDADAAEFTAAAPGVPVTRLRRGVDTGLFHPAAGDREDLTEEHGVPPGVPLVLFAGRVDASKGAPLVASAVARLRDGGTPAHLVLAGDGAAVPGVRRLLGPAVTHLGHLPQAELARVYAACDVLAFPSRSETVGNVVAEAMAAGLPVLLAAGSRTAQWLAAPGRDGVLVPGDEPRSWAGALAPLLADAARRRDLGVRARRTVEARAPSWADVVREDLLPVWRRAATPVSRPSRPLAAPAAPAPPPPASAG